MGDDGLVEAATKKVANGAWDTISDVAIDTVCTITSIVGFPVGYPLWKIKKWIKGGDLTWWEAARACAADLKGYARKSTAGTLGQNASKTNWLFYAIVGGVGFYFIAKKYKK